MLFIKFKIQDKSKYTDFKNLFKHMVAVRQPNFRFEEEDASDFDWDAMTDAEMEEALKKIDESDDENGQQVNRYKILIPGYANAFLERYLKIDADKLGVLGIEKVLSILNYLEFDFEVDMNKLKKLDEYLGIVEFSTGNFPFGGTERFLMTLKAFDLIPIECFDGFSILEYNWTSDFEFDATELPEQTKVYLEKLGY